MDDPSGISGYIVALQKAPVGEGDATETQTELGNTTSYEISLDCGRTYRWLVRARDGAGYLSVWSEGAVFSTIGPPPAPTALAPGWTDPGFEILNSCTVVLSWTAVSHPGGIAYYEAKLQNCTMDGASCSGGQTYSTTQTTYDVTSEVIYDLTFESVLSSIFWRWNVRAIDHDGRVSEPSSWLYFKEKPCP